MRPREAALAAGEKTYFTGKPCKNGHVAERDTILRVCLQCRKDAANAHYRKHIANNPEYNAKRKEWTDSWRKKHPEKIAIHNKNHREKHPEKVKQRLKTWYQANKDRAYETNKKRRREKADEVRKNIADWKARNPERHKELQRAGKISRRGRQRGNGGRCTAKDIRDIFLKYDNKCNHCGSADRLEIDHIIAVANGGTSDPSNLQLLCHPCNRSKGTLDYDVWRKQQGFSLLICA